MPIMGPLMIRTDSMARRRGDFRPYRCGTTQERPLSELKAQRDELREMVKQAKVTERFFR